MTYIKSWNESALQTSTRRTLVAETRYDGQMQSCPRSAPLPALQTPMVIRLPCPSMSTPACPAAACTTVPKARAGQRPRRCGIWQASSATRRS